MRKHAPKEMLDRDGFGGLYDRGVARGFSEIKTDSIRFLFRDEEYNIPSIHAVRIAKWNGYFYEAQIKAVRKLAKELAH